MPSVSLLFFSLKPFLHDLELQNPVCLHPSYKTLSLFSQLNNPSELQKKKKSYKPESNYKKVTELTASPVATGNHQLPLHLCWPGYK